MTTIVTRAVKGSPLTITEMDANFNNLNNNKLEVTSPTFAGNAATATTTTGHALGNDDVGSGGVGIIAIMKNNSGSSVVIGATVAGSSLQFVAFDAADGHITGSTGVGTYRSIGGAVVNGWKGVFQRIS